MSCPACFLPRTPKPPGEGGMTRSLSGGVLAGTVKEVGIFVLTKSNSRPIWVDNVSVVLDPIPN